jgi:NAD(P)H-hydrate epimerase
MEQAGCGIADVLVERYAPMRGKRVLVLVGPGNNGGDGLVIARHLHDAGAQVTLHIWQRNDRPDDQPWRECQARRIPELRADDDPTHAQLEQLSQQADIVVDALLGIGVTRPLAGSLRAIVEAVNAVRAARMEATPIVVAVDLPTGINADTGAMMGAAIQADLTVATGILKRGHELADGRSAAGEVTCVSIGLPSQLEEQLMTETLTANALRNLLPARPADANKGTFGKVMVIAGAGRYPGAAFLSASGALRSGAGLVTLACGRSIFSALAAALHETTFLPLPEEDWGVLGTDAAREVQENLDGYKALVLGPGLGREDATKTFLSRLLKLETPQAVGMVGFLKTASATPPERRGRPGGFGFRRAEAGAQSSQSEQAETTADQLPPLVLDADGLFLLAQIDGWWQELPAGQVILTPHPGEMARLLKLDDAAQVNEDRLGTAQQAAQEWQQIVVLKGAETVIASPDGQTSIGPSGNPALATAGTGDVLAGLIGGLLAQGVAPFDAARLGVWLHAEAGQLVRREVGEAGAVAGDLLPRLPRALTQLRVTREN